MSDQRLIGRPRAGGLSGILPGIRPTAEPRPAQAHPASEAGLPRWAVAATLALAACSVALGVAAALARGPWMDEFWTLWAADPALPWRQALRERWLTDVHPPLFLAFSRLLAGALGPEVTIRRLQNLLPVLLLLAAFAHAVLAWPPRARRFLATAAVLAFSSYFMTGYLAEYRSYLAQFCLGLILFGAAYALLSEELGLGAAARRRAGAAVLVAALLLVNLHFVTALVALISLAGLAALALAERRTGLAVLFCAAAVLSAAPLAVTTALQLHDLLGRTGGHFWIETGLGGAIPIVLGSLAKGAGGSAVAVAAAAMALRSDAAPIVGRRRGDRRIGLALLGIVAVAILVLLAVNLQTPIIIDRYLVLCSAALVCALAILARDILFERRLGFVLLLANAAAFMALCGAKLLHEPRWNATADRIEAAMAACPTARVEAFQFVYPGTLPNEAAVLSQAFRYLGDHHGFAVQAARPGGYALAGSGRPCGDILWTEHVLWTRGGDPDADDRLVRDQAARVVGPVDPSRTAVVRTKTGAVILPIAEHRP